ncbi:nad-dependent histone deacetylase sir2-like [Dermatophagoides farinae]|uniref:protein acetyllysine N-acetyltransferase n=1 Tax=Dermatophagoides farinae TaxID=6954 RepID=A0A9D4NTZ9_DERFA|nr:nad-dependent histone deacetylase sir2-like [Dermatophagoides farinae]
MNVLNVEKKIEFSTGQIFEPFVPTTKRLRREQSNCYDVVTTSRTTKDNTAAITTIDTVNVATSAAPFVEGRDIDVLYDVGDSSRISAAIDDESCCSRSRHLFSSPPYTTVTVSSSNSDNELMSNGDSGFQELQIPYDSLSVGSDNKTVNNSNNNLTNKMEDAIAIDGNNSTTNSISRNQMTMATKSASVAGESPNSDTMDIIIAQQQRLYQSSSNSNQNNHHNEDVDDEIDDDDDDDNISEFSYASDLSNLSGEDWKPINKNIEWIQRQISNGSDPKEIIEQLTGSELIGDIDNAYAWRLLIRMLSEPSVRSKLDYINTISDVIDLIQNSKKIIVLTGAGVSVSCGIPDFRSRNGVYARLSKDYPDLPDPQSMFDIHYFKKNPYPFFKFAKEIYPGQFQPSPSHKFIKYLEIEGRLLRNYSQNIDTLEQTAGIKNVITCHGSFATATCTVCGYRCDSNAIRNDIFAQNIPLCPHCAPRNNNNNNNISQNIHPSSHHRNFRKILPVMKPDIVFFGEGLSDEFHNSMTIDKDQCDLLIVIGSSLKVSPVALIPGSIPKNIPQILINREPLNHLNFDVELLGDCDVIIRYLCQLLGDNWSRSCFGQDQNDDIEKLPKSATEEIPQDNVDNVNGQLQQTKEYEFIAPSRYIFRGAELNESFDSDSNDDSHEDEIQNVDDAESFVEDDTNDEILVPNQSQDISMMIDGEQSLVMMNESNSGTNSNESSMTKDDHDVMGMIQSPGSTTKLMIPSINDESMMMMMMTTDET